MRLSFLGAVFFLSGVLFAQVITPAYVISNRQQGIKEVKVWQRTAFKDFELKAIKSYNKEGFPVKEEQFLPEGKQRITTYSYKVNSEEPMLTVTISKGTGTGQDTLETYNLVYNSGTLYETKVEPANLVVSEFKHYRYDQNWNLMAMNEMKIVGGDTSIVQRHTYSVQTDVFNRLVSTNHSELDSHIDYYYDENGVLLSTAIFDGPARRTTEYRMYNENGLLELSVVVINRGGGLMAINRYKYETYKKSKPGIFEKWMPVAHPESVMQER